MSTLPTFREVFDAWFFYLTNEGNSSGIASKLTAIATGLALVSICASIAKLIKLWRGR